MFKIKSLFLFPVYVSNYWSNLCIVKLPRGSWEGVVVRVLANVIRGSIPGLGVIMWVEFVVGSLLCSDRCFSGYSGFPLSSKTNTSKFQIDPE